MGAVYKAEDTKLRRPVALKCLPLRLASDEKVKQRFVHEAQASSALNHPNIATIYYMFEEEGQEFICMEYVEGQTLTECLSSGPLPCDQALDITLQVADGLFEAHKKGIVHRDIKSDNIMVTPRGLVKIMDFGLAKLKGASRLTRTGSTMGTIAYMSPEQAQGLEVDHRTDVFSLGVVLYEMLAGKRPFEGEHEAAVLYSLLNEDPKPLRITPEMLAPIMATVLQKSLEKDRTERYQTMEEMLADLRGAKRLLEGTPTPTPPGREGPPISGGVTLDPEHLVGQTIGNYQIIEEIGRGGMGIVYKALQISLNRVVALKVLPKQYTLDPEFLSRFRREARSAASLNHPNIVQIYEIGQHSGIHYFVMEFIEGTNLKTLIEREAPFPLLRTIDIIWDTCKALDFAHERGVVHRDIKPHNIMIGKTGEAKVFDFGIARAADSAGLTTTGTSIGTPQYMSPEQARGEKEMDGRADIYSLGVVFYEMLVGKVPFEGSTAVGTMYRHVNEMPEFPSKQNPNIPEEVDRIVMKALQKDSEKRYQTGEKMIADLRLIKQSFPDDVVEAGRIRRKRRRGAVALIVITTALLLGTAGIYYFGLMKRHDFILKTEPPGASAFEGGTFLGQTPLEMKEENIGLGDHTLRVTMPGHAEEVYTFSLQRGEKIDHLLLLSQSYGALKVQTDPPGAHLTLDGVDRGLTPLEAPQLKIGSHVLAFTLPGYVPQQDTVYVQDGSADTVVRKLFPFPTDLLVSSVPESANIWIDSLALEDRTPSSIQLNPGEHRVRVVKDGFATKETLLTFAPGASYPVSFTLSKVENVVVFGSLKATVIPRAEVSLDGKILGTTEGTKTFERIAPGTHTVKLTCPGYPAYERSIRILENQQATLSHDFTATGWLNISCIDNNRNPVFGEIWIDGTSYGLTPKVVRDLFVGRHRVEVVAEGYASESREATIRNNEGEKIQFIMKSSP